MPANVRHNLRHLCFENSVVSIDRVFEAVFPMQRHLRHSVLVSEKKSYMSINHNLWKICRSVFQDRLEHSVHIFQHWNLSCSGVCLRRFNVVFYIVESLKLMGHVNDSVFHIKIFDGQSAEF